MNFGEITQGILEKPTRGVEAPGREEEGYSVTPRLTWCGEEAVNSTRCELKDREESWSGLPGPPPGVLPCSGVEPGSPTLQADSLLSEPPEHIHTAMCKTAN